MKPEDKAVVDKIMALAESWRTAGCKGEHAIREDHLRGAIEALLEQPADHSEQDLDMVENGDLLTIVYMDGLHTGKKMAKREWVGLTNEECIEIAARGYPRWLEFAQAVETKLREKNGGGA
jgi:hypothetical protein